MLAEYGIGEKQQVILADMANPRRVQGWYETYTDVLPGAYQDYLVLEAWASRISAYEAQRIPALLQTPAYARALAEADPGLADDDARDRAVGATLVRQKAILGERDPDIHVVIGEAALRQEVGGPTVMQGQLEMLARTSGDSATSTIQILPFTRGHTRLPTWARWPSCSSQRYLSSELCTWAAPTGASSWKAERTLPLTRTCLNS